MINPQTVFLNVKMLIDIPPDDEDKMLNICDSCAQSLSRRLKEGFTGAEKEAVYACSAFAVYRYALIKGCLDDYCEYLKTGDITVSRSSSSLLESAEKMVTDAFSGADCFTDTNFIFRGM